MAPSPKPTSAKLKNPLFLLLVASLMAGAVAWLAYYYLQQREEAMKADMATKAKRGTTPRVSLAVPVADVPAGTVLNGTNFVSRPVEQDLVYPDSILADDFPSMEGLKLARPVLRGRPLRMSDLVAPEVDDVATIVPAGRRALTIEIDNTNSIAQTLRPGHHIDLFLLSKGTRRSGDGEDGDANLDQATLYMQDVVVLATGTEFRDVSQNPENGSDSMVRPGEIAGKEKEFDSVTVLVTPRDAARLMVGQKMGSYRVALRGSKDRAPVRMGTLRGSDLLPGARRGRDAGIEFIVGGGSEKLVTQMSVPPSMAIASAMRQQGFGPAPAATSANSPVAGAH